MSAHGTPRSQGKGEPSTRGRSRWFLVLAAALVCLRAAAVEYLAKPWVTNVKHDSATIAWLTKEQEALATVEYGPTPRYGKTAKVWKVQTSDWRKNPVVKVMKAKLTGLRPGASCHYRVGGAGLPEYRNTFRTAPRDRNSPVVFVFGGDYNMPSDAEMQFVAKRTGRPVDFFLDLGDHAIPRRFRREWQGSIPTFLARGNHDNEKGTRDRGGRGKIGQIEKFYDFDDDKLDYVVNWGPVTLVLMGRMARYAKPLKPEQLRWIEEQYSRSNSPWKLFACHWVMFSDGSHGQKNEGENKRRQLWPLFKKCGAQLQLNGHDHTYQRTHRVDGEGNPDPRGTMSVTHGGKKSNFREQSPWTAFRNEIGTDGVSYVFIDKGVMKIEMWVKGQPLDKAEIRLGR